MFSRSIGATAIFLCMTFILQNAWADDVEAKLRQHEARLIYESASQLVDDERYDKAIRRFDRIRFEYPETEYARLAESKKFEAVALKYEPKHLSGMSRASLVGFGTLFTTWLGIGTLILADSEGPETAGIVLIIAPLGGLAGSMKLARKIKLNDGQASLINLGGYWGIWQATGAALVADAGERATVGASMAGGIIGLALSASIVQGRYITPGDATMINFGGIWGTWFALCGAMLADLEDEDGILTSSMIGGDIGLFTMAALSPKIGMSRARARLINISGVVGALYGLGTNVLLEIDSKRDFWSVLGIGSILGLAAGAYFTRDYDAEDGYFARAITSNDAFGRSIETGVSSMASSYETGRKRQASGINLRVPLFTIRF